MLDGGQCQACGHRQHSRSWLSLSLSNSVPKGGFLLFLNHITYYCSSNLTANKTNKRTSHYKLKRVEANAPILAPPPLALVQKHSPKAHCPRSTGWGPRQRRRWERKSRPSRIHHRDPPQMVVVISGTLSFFLIYLLIMLLQLSHFPPHTPLHPAHPLPPTFPPIVHVHGSYL